MKNTFALVNRTPPEVLSLIPDYVEDSERNEASITLTHVCRGWRELFISRPSLWARLDCRSIEKTRVYIDRSKNSPLEIHLDGHYIPSYCEEAFLLAVPHASRVKTLSAIGWLPSDSPALLQTLVEQFSRPVPLLEKLKIDVLCTTPTLPTTLFNGDVSSLRELSLTGILMPPSWMGLGNLTIFNLCDLPDYKIPLTHLLDFFESAPRLRDIRLRNSIPHHSDAPPERIVPLPNLIKLKTIGHPVNSVLLNHLSIPSGASVALVFTFRGPILPFPAHIPDTLDNLDNISRIATINLCFGPDRRAMRLNGPSGELCVLGNWAGEAARPHTDTPRFLRFLNRFDTSRCRQLGISQCRFQQDLLTSVPIKLWSTYQFLFSMGDLRVLTLIESFNLPFILTLNPDKTPDKIVLCPKLEDIILYVNLSGGVHIDELLSMTEERASRGAKLSTITIVSTCALTPTMEVFRLRNHVSRVEYKFDNAPPAWDGHAQFESNS